MKPVKIVLPLALCLCLALSACDDSNTKDTTPATQKKPETTAVVTTTAAPETTQAAEAQAMTWGDWTIDVPAGWQLKGGDWMDENDVRYFSVKKSDFSYFDFKADGEEQIMNHYNYNKNTYTNEQKDVTGTFGGNEWVGFQYSDGLGGYGFEAYTTVDGVMIRVSSVGYAFDNEVANAVLSSLQHSASSQPVTDTTEAAPETETVETAAQTEAEPTEGAPVYVKTVELKDVTVGIKEGYTEVKDAAPYQYVMTNDATFGTVFIQNQAGNAGDAVTGIMSGLEYETSEMDLNGMHWTVAKSDTLWCFAATIGDDVLSFTISYGATEEEMQDLMFSATLKAQG